MLYVRAYIAKLKDHTGRAQLLSDTMILEHLIVGNKYAFALRRRPFRRQAIRGRFSNRRIIQVELNYEVTQ